MRTTDGITLHLTADGIDSYCRDLSRRSPSLEKRVAALDALITFVSSQADAGEQATAEFAAIRQLLLDHFEEARNALLDDRARRLQQALAHRNLSAITSLYTSLSRDAFWTLLVRTEQQLAPSAQAALRDWAATWLSQARQRALQTSPYPDAIDFSAAGIDATEYLAMSDLCRSLEVNNRS